MKNPVILRGEYLLRSTREAWELWLRNQEEVLDHRSLQHVYKSCIDLNEEEETALQALGVAVGSKTDKVAPQPFF